MNLFGFRNRWPRRLAESQETQGATTFSFRRRTDSETQMPPDEPRPHERLAFRRTKSTGDGGHVDETWVAQESSVVVLLADEDDPSSVKAATTEAERKDEKPKPASAKPQTKILFLDGVRGLAAILVVTQHSGFMHDVNLGACAVDIFFVLSSFLLTWLFYKKSTQLFAQKASYRKWGFALVDYFSKRFFRVYPLFAVVTIVLWLLPDKAKKQYFHVAKPEDFDLFKVLTFQFDYRYHVFWTLPLEIVYYFLIPVFVLLTLRLHRFWWIPLAPMYVWVVYKGLYAFRTSHMPLRPHLPTFLSGSMAAVIFVKLEQTIKQQAFEFCVWHKCLVRALEYAVLGLLVSTCFNGLLFHWTQKDPELPTKVPKGFPYISLHVTVLIVIEMLLPSWLSSALEWSVLRFWGKISFSVYLLHSFVIYAIPVRKQAYYYDRLFSGFLLTLLLATASYYAVEHLSQLLSVRISKALAAREALVGKPIRSPGEVMESGQSQKEDEVMVVAAVAAPH